MILVSNPTKIHTSYPLKLSERRKRNYAVFEL